MIGDLDGLVNYDPYISNFSDIQNGLLILFSVMNMDLYPESMIPAITYSYFYLPYFIIFLMLFHFFFIPIPIAALYSQFKEVRLQIMLKQRIDQRSLLFVCFLSMDVQRKGYMSYEDFLQLMKATYKKLYDEKRVVYLSYCKCQMVTLFRKVDDNQNNKISLEEFFEVIDLIEQDEENSPFLLATPECWERFRNFVLSKYTLSKILENEYFHLFILFINVADTCIYLLLLFMQAMICVSIFTDNTHLKHQMDEGSEFFAIVYVIEMVMKIINDGFRKVFQDNWNMYEAAILLIPFYSLEVILIFSTVGIQTILSGAPEEGFDSFTWIIKIQSLFRIIRSLRALKIFNFIFMGFSFFTTLSELVTKLLVCIPPIFRFVQLLVIIIYTFSVIAIEIMNPDSYTDEQLQELLYYSKNLDFYHWATIETTPKEKFWGINLELLQFLIGWGEWTYIEIQGSIIFDSLFASLIFYQVYMMIGYYVLVSLIRGIVWDFFSVLSAENDQDHHSHHSHQKEHHELEAVPSTLLMTPQNQKPFLEPKNQSLSLQKNTLLDETFRKKSSNLITNEDYSLIGKKQKQLKPFASRGQQTNFLSILKPLKDIVQEALQTEDFDPLTHILDLNEEVCQQYLVALTSQLFQKQKSSKEKVKVKLTNKLLMKMTLLDEQLLAKVKKVEITYFMKRFGSKFMGIREIDYLQIHRSLTFRVSSVFLNTIEHYQNAEEFVSRLLWIEQLILSSINIPGTTCKFIFNNEENMSYSISGGGDEDYVVSRLGSVFWSSILKKISVSSDNYLVRRDEVTKQEMLKFIDLINTLTEDENASSFEYFLLASQINTQKKMTRKKMNKIRNATFVAEDDVAQFIYTHFQITSFQILLSVPKSKADGEIQADNEEQVKQLIINCLNEHKKTDQIKSNIDSQNNKEFEDWEIREAIPIALATDMLCTIKNILMTKQKEFFAYATLAISNKITLALKECL